MNFASENKRGEGGVVERGYSPYVFAYQLWEMGDRRKQVLEVRSWMRTRADKSAPTVSPNAFPFNTIIFLWGAEIAPKRCEEI